MLIGGTWIHRIIDDIYEKHCALTIPYSQFIYLQSVLDKLQQKVGIYRL